MVDPLPLCGRPLVRSPVAQKDWGEGLGNKESASRRYVNLLSV